MCIFSGAEKEGEAVCGSQQFFSGSFAAEKKRTADNPGFFQ